MNRNFMDQEDFEDYVDYQTMNEEDEPLYNHFNTSEHDTYTEEKDEKSSDTNKEPGNKEMDKNSDNENSKTSSEEKEKYVPPDNLAELFLDIMERFFEGIKKIPEWIATATAKTAGVFLHAVIYGNDTPPVTYKNPSQEPIKNAKSENGHAKDQSKANAFQNQKETTKKEENSKTESEKHKKRDQEKNASTNRSTDRKSYSIDEMVQNGIYQNAARYIIQYSYFKTDALINPFGLKKEEAENILKKMQDDRIVTTPNEKGVISPMMNQKELKTFFETGVHPHPEKKPEKEEKMEDAPDVIIMDEKGPEAAPDVIIMGEKEPVSVAEKENKMPSENIHEENYKNAVQFVLKKKQCDTATLSSDLGLSFQESCDIVDRMEKEGVVTKPDIWGEFSVNSEYQVENMDPKINESKYLDEKYEIDDTPELTEEELLNFCQNTSDTIFHSDIETEMDYSDFDEPDGNFDEPDYDEEFEL